MDTIKALSHPEGSESVSLRRPTKKESTVELETDIGDSAETGRSRLQESLAELLKSIDLTAARDEIRSGFMGMSKEEVEKTRQIAKIRARVQHKQHPK